jgi:hypothetical protein
MNKKELIDALKDIPDNTIIVLSKDSEGNSYSPLANVESMMYTADSKWSGEIHLPELTDELIEQGYSEEDIRTVDDGAIPCIVLWPTN